MPGELPRIVVVEDDASMSQALARILCAGGFEPATFASAEAALEANVGTLADCFVLDIHLPGASGLDLYRVVVAAGAEVPVVFITAHDDSGIRKEAKRMGASGYLLKPFSGRTLLEAITEALGSH